jgi:hypothetical protein
MDTAIHFMENNRMMRDRMAQPTYEPYIGKMAIKYRGKTVKKIPLTKGSGLYFQVPPKPCPPNLFTDARALSLWINGASDHLYDLTIPKNLPKKLGRRIWDWRCNVLDWGHGKGLCVLNGMPIKEYQYIRKEFNDIVFEIDKWVSSRPVRADYY